MSSDRIVVNGKEFEKFLTHENIVKRIEQVCSTLNERFADSRPLFLGILNGAFMFTAEVISRMKMECEVSFVKLRSYEGDQSTGTVTTMLGLETSLKGRDIIILEDIVDSGRTLHHLFPVLDSEEPRSVSLFALLVKPDALQYEIPITYAGFAVPNHFLVGYGLDYDGLGRNLNDIYKAV